MSHDALPAMVPARGGGCRPASASSVGHPGTHPRRRRLRTSTGTATARRVGQARPVPRVVGTAAACGSPLPADAARHSWRSRRSARASFPVPGAAQTAAACTACPYWLRGPISDALHRVQWGANHRRLHRRSDRDDRHVGSIGLTLGLAGLAAATRVFLTLPASRLRSWQPGGSTNAIVSHGTHL